MPVWKKNVAPLFDRAVQSITLATELFNRPTETARAHSVLILLQHAFEMLLKAAILQRTGNIHDREKRYTYGFDKCLTLASELSLLTPDEKSTLSILDAQRDQAAHYYVEMSEDVLYVHAQSAVTLFDALLQRSFGRRFADTLPNRVLPISTRPPRDLTLLLSSELAEVDKLLSSGSRQGARAAAKLRTILAFAIGSREDKPDRVPEADIEAAIARRRKKQDWNVILPEIAQLRLQTDGSGIPISMRISKDAPIAIRVARPGEPVEGILLKQEIDPWTVFTMSRDDLAKKLELSGPRTHALIYELGLQEDPACYKELWKKSQVFKGYSRAALEKLRDAKSRLDLEQVWMRHRGKLTSARPESR